LTRFARMRMTDIPYAVDLSSREQWDTPSSDFMRILRIDPSGSFVAFEGNSRVGIATTISFSRKLAWIGNVIVDKKHRGKRIGQGLMNHAINHLTKRQIRHIGLYCFEDNVDFYRKLGFEGETRFARLRRPRGPPRTYGDETEMRPSMSQVMSMDRTAFGADRSALIQSWIDENSGTYVGFRHKMKSGFLLVKKYSRMFDFGPGAAFGADEIDLRKLLVVSLANTWKRPIEASCLVLNRTMLNLLIANGFRIINRGFRMYWNHSVKLGSDGSAILLGFPDKG